MKLVGLVLTKWAPHLPDRAFRLLMRMAMTAQDEASEKAPADMFFGGRDLLASVLRSERHGSIQSLERAIERGINDLVSIGAIERVNRPRAGFRAEYRLTLFSPIRIEAYPSTDQVQPDTHGGAQPDTHGQEPDTHGGAQPDTHGYFSPTPTGGPRSNEERRKEKEEEQREEEDDDLSLPLTLRARDEAANTTSKCGSELCFEINGVFYIPNPEKKKGQRNIRCPTCNSPNVIPFERRRA